MRDTGSTPAPPPLRGHARPAPPGRTVALFAGDTASREPRRDRYRHGGPVGVRRIRDLGRTICSTVSADWGPAATPAGAFHLVPVQVERDLAARLPLDERSRRRGVLGAGGARVEDRGACAPGSSTRRAQRPVPRGARGPPDELLGDLPGGPRPPGGHYPARPHDTGIHLLIGGVADRGRGFGRPCSKPLPPRPRRGRSVVRRVVAEPDLRNIPSVSAFLSAGFRFSAEVDLPGKRAALMVRDRFLARSAVERSPLVHCSSPIRFPAEESPCRIPPPPRPPERRP